jgi:2-C-methyl-D-erythritol 4-phosphate cytidylyltransferase
LILELTASDSWVLVHDAARPLVALSDIQRLTSTIYNTGAVGGLLATPVQDTLKKADDYCCVEQTVNRQQLWQAQTPQLFRAGPLLSALESAGEAVTDEASAMEHAGHDPQLVEALQPNFKITRPVDMRLAELLLTSPGHA